MHSSLLSWLGCLNCFRRKSSFEIIDRERPPQGFDADDKEPAISSHSIGTTIQESGRPSQESARKGAELDLKKQPAIVERTVSDNESAAVARQKKSKHNQSLLVVAKRQYQLVDKCAYPTLAHGREVIVRPRAVGLNPIDWMSVDYGFCLPELPWITGRECAGVVEQVGSEVTDIHVGDLVWTSTYYRDRRAGCFQQFVTVPEHTVWPIPANLTFEQAATLGVAGLTAAMTLWKWLEVRPPNVSSHAAGAMAAVENKSDEYLLIWGGATMTGQFATQIARLSGSRTICVASESSKSLCESLGASYVVTRDGKSTETIVEEIRAIASDKITRAIDLVGPATASAGLSAVSKQQTVLFAPLAMMDKQSQVAVNVRVQTVEMEQFVLNADNAGYAGKLNEIIRLGLVKTPELDVVEGGLAMVEKGLDMVKTGNRNGRKVVVTVS